MTKINKNLQRQENLQVGTLEGTSSSNQFYATSPLMWTTEIASSDLLLKGLAAWTSRSLSPPRGGLLYKSDGGIRLKFWKEPLKGTRILWVWSEQGFTPIKWYQL